MPKLLKQILTYLAVAGVLWLCIKYPGFWNWLSHAATTLAGNAWTGASRLISEI
jgi:hypothetical protein